MPNWTQNKLTITHTDADVIDNLMAMVRSDDDERLFHHIKPMPEELGDGEGWYEWAVSNWSTKWDACHMSYHQHDEHTVSFDFDSAWSPPYAVYEEMAEQGFEVEAYYVEYGMMFAGEWHCDSDGNFSNEFISDISEGVTPDIDEAFDVTNQLQEWAEENDYA